MFLKSLTDCGPHATSYAVELLIEIAKIGGRLNGQLTDLLIQMGLHRLNSYVQLGNSSSEHACGNVSAHDARETPPIARQNNTRPAHAVCDSLRSTLSFIRSRSQIG